mgnify:CR=1 FL=1
MAVTITPDGTATFLTDITRPNFTMNQTVSASATAPAGQVANVTNVTASVVGTQPSLVIRSGSTSVSITGDIEDPFLDQFTYVEQGESDKTQPPVTVERIPNMPADKLMYNLNQYCLRLLTILNVNHYQNLPLTIKMHQQLNHYQL